MVIETASKTYLVIGYLEQDGEKDVYLCENTLNQEQFLIICIKRQELVLKSMEFLYKQVYNAAFTDLAECFVYREHLHLAFCHRKGEALQEKLGSEYASIEERMEIGKRLLEKIILLSMPCYFQCQCLKPMHIFVARNLDVSFEYSIDDLGAYDTYTVKDMHQGVKAVMELLFREELKKEVLAPMKLFLDRLNHSHDQSCLEVYKDYLQVCEEIAALSKQTMEIPKTWIFRMWDRIKKLIKPLKRLVMIALLLAVLVFMIWTFDQIAQPALSESVISQIGTLKVK